jgi:protein-L-isoaspartate(D-aspartate) O-methyltransferase
VILTVGAWEIVPAWLEQLKPDGRLLLPLSLNGPQFSIAFEREDGRLVSRSIAACGFMRLRGENAGSFTTAALNAEQTIHLAYEGDLDGTAETELEKLRAWLAGPAQDIAAGLQVTPSELWAGLSLWLALNEPQLVTLSARGEAVQSSPCLFLLGAASSTPWSITMGMAGSEGMAFFSRPPDWSISAERPSEETEPFELHIRAFGPGETVAGQLRQHALAWDVAGRPGPDGMRVRVYPLDNRQEGENILNKRWHQFVVDWP